MAYIVHRIWSDVSFTYRSGFEKPWQWYLMRTPINLGQCVSWFLDKGYYLLRSMMIHMSTLKSHTWANGSPYTFTIEVEWWMIWLVAKQLPTIPTIRLYPVKYADHLARFVFCVCLFVCFLFVMSHAIYSYSSALSHPYSLSPVAFFTNMV